jgi:hypothetical protein
MGSAPGHSRDIQTVPLFWHLNDWVLYTFFVPESRMLRQYQFLHGGQDFKGGELADVEGLGGDEVVHDVRGAEVEAEELDGQKAQ